MNDPQYQKSKQDIPLDKSDTKKEAADKDVENGKDKEPPEDPNPKTNPTPGGSSTGEKTNPRKEAPYEIEFPSIPPMGKEDLERELERLTGSGNRKGFTPEFYPGSTTVGINRRKHMSGNLKKLRDIPEADVVAIMGHRAPGADYSSTHPPLKEMGEPDCPIRQFVTPNADAAGDRVRYSQWNDSMYFAPSVPYFRSYWAAINCRGCDPGILTGKQINEARERDIERYTKAQYDSEMTDVALCSMRGCTVHGHSLRLDENGMQFDMLARTEMGKDGNVYAVKDRVGIPLDRKINVGKPMTEAEAKKRTTIFRADGIPMCGKVGARKYDEAVEALKLSSELRNKRGYKPE